MVSYLFYTRKAEVVIDEYGHHYVRAYLPLCQRAAVYYGLQHIRHYDEQVAYTSVDINV